MFIAGIVLAAGRSERLGRPKQLLDIGGGTLLDAALDAARACRFEQLIVAIGGAGDDVRAGVDLSGCTVVDNVHHASGCSSSIVAALDRIDPGAAGVMILLGDQPGIEPATVDAVRRSVGMPLAPPPIAVCRYTDGRGHPFWFARSMFPALAELHGDKAVWKLIESDRYAVVEVPVAAPVPLDVDTWDDYRRLLESRR